MEKLAIGKIRTSHGVKGYLKVLSFSGETDHFFSLEEVVLRNRNRDKVLGVEDVKVSGRTLLVKFRGIDTPEDGKRYNGWEIWVDKAQASPLGPDEFYVSDMIGCRLLLGSDVIGTVKGVTDSNADDLLEVGTKNGSILIPFREEFIGAVDIENGTIILKDDRLLP